MRRFPTSALLTRVERIKNLSHDLANELVRKQGETVAASALADAIKRDADAVQRALKPSLSASIIDSFFSVQKGTAVKNAQQLC